MTDLQPIKKGLLFKFISFFFVHQLSWLIIAYFFTFDYLRDEFVVNYLLNTNLNKKIEVTIMVKLYKNYAKIDTLIANACECEPYITADYRECLENPESVLEGIYRYGLNNLAASLQKTAEIEILIDTAVVPESPANDTQAEENNAE